MKKLKIFSVMVFASLIIVNLMSVSFAQVPQTFNYQGTLTDSSGNLIEAPPSPLLALTFRIYDSYTGGNLVWGPETHNNVMVKKGIFSVILGNSVPINETHFSGPDRYISVQVGADPEMSPRQKINSVPYAFKAGDATPAGVIVMWSGAVNQIPAGWALCDGNNGTPNLRDRFIVGAGSSYAVGATGGEATHTLTVNEMPSHTHIQDAHTHVQNAHTHNVRYEANQVISLDSASGKNAWQDSGQGTMGAPSNLIEATTASNQNTTATNQNTGGGVAHENRPPYYAIAFIMKL